MRQSRRRQEAILFIQSCQYGVNSVRIADWTIAETKLSVNGIELILLNGLKLAPYGAVVAYEPFPSPLIVLL
jgi:hypothetical protein